MTTEASNSWEEQLQPFTKTNNLSSTCKRPHQQRRFKILPTYLGTSGRRTIAEIPQILLCTLFHPLPASLVFWNNMVEMSYRAMRKSLDSFFALELHLYKVSQQCDVTILLLYEITACPTSNAPNSFSYVRRGRQCRFLRLIKYCCYRFTFTFELFLVIQHTRYSVAYLVVFKHGSCSEVLP